MSDLETTVPPQQQQQHHDQPSPPPSQQQLAVPIGDVASATPKEDSRARRWKCPFVLIIILVVAIIWWRVRKANQQDDDYFYCNPDLGGADLKVPLNLDMPNVTVKFPTEHWECKGSRRKFNVMLVDDLYKVPNLEVGGNFDVYKGIGEREWHSKYNESNIVYGYKFQYDKFGKDQALYMTFYSSEPYSNSSFRMQQDTVLLLSGAAAIAAANWSSSTQRNGQQALTLSIQNVSGVSLPDDAFNLTSTALGHASISSFVYETIRRNTANSTNASATGTAMRTTAPTTTNYSNTST
jgi:hypothetical protein